MLSGRVATSQTAGTIRGGRRIARRDLRSLFPAIALAIVASALAAALAPVAIGQTVEFAAVPTVFPATGSNTGTTQTIAVHVVTAAAISSITVPVSFVANPDFVVLGQTGCTVDGTTVNAAGTTCSVTVGFRPVAAGVRTGTLLITDGAGATTAFGLTGTGYYSQVAITPAAARVVAGLGPTVTGYAGDGGASIAATLNAPQGVAADSFGNVFFADTGNNVVRMLDAFGNVTTVAGGGSVAGSAADGGPATAAALNQPTWLAVDSAGNLYISETGSNVIRRVTMSSTKTISTVAGSYVAGSSEGTSALTAQLNNPQGIVVDVNGSLYIADKGNQKIRLVDPSSGLISTVAGTGEVGPAATSVGALGAQFNGPAGLALDQSGNLFIADSGNHVVRELANGNVTIAAGTGTAGHTGDGGAATAATLATPSGLAIDAAGDLLIADAAAGNVRKIEAGTGIIDVYAGEAKDAGSYTAGVSPSTSTRMNGPMGIALDATQNLYIADTGNNVVRLVSGSPGEVAFAAQAVGNTSSAATVRVSNIGNAPLTFNSVAAISGTSTNFVLTNNGGASCSGSVAAGAHCTFTVAFAPQAAGFMAGEIDLVDNAGINSNFTYTQQVYLMGGVQTPLTIGPATLPSILEGHAYSATVTANGGYGTVTLQTSGTLPPGMNSQISGSTLTLSGTPTTAGTYTFTVYASDTLNQQASQTYTITVLPQTITFALTEAVHVTDAITKIPELVLNITEGVHVTDARSYLPGLSLNVTESVHVADAITKTPGLTLNITETVTVTDTLQNIPTKLSQTITPSFIGTRAYGDAPFSVTATASSGLPVTIAVQSGPAVLTNGKLDLTGAGTVTLIYSQAGNATYAAVSSTVNVKVERATATITAGSATRSFGQPNPAFTYSVSGLVHGDAAISGTPLLSTTAVVNSNAGTYPITASQGSLSGVNYSFNFVPGTLTITGHVAQTITFLTIPNVPLSVSTLTLTAHSTSGLTVSYDVTGPATIYKNKLTLTGAGIVRVTASQPGNMTFDPATTVVRSFTVTP